MKFIYDMRGLQMAPHYIIPAPNAVNHNQPVPITRVYIYIMKLNIKIVKE